MRCSRKMLSCGWSQTVGPSQPTQVNPPFTIISRNNMRHSIQSAIHILLRNPRCCVYRLCRYLEVVGWPLYLACKGVLVESTLFGKWWSDSRRSRVTSVSSHSAIGWRRSKPILRIRVILGARRPATTPIWKTRIDHSAASCSRPRGASKCESLSDLCFGLGNLGHRLAISLA
jgi:hypothetical protein